MLHDAVSIAGYLHRLANSRLDREVNALAVANALGVELDPDVPPGCDGVLPGPANDGPLRILVDADQPAPIVLDEVAHELGHLAARLLCLRRPHGEPLMNRVAALIQVPNAAMLSALRDVGWSAPSLASAFPSIRADVVLERAALCGGGAAILYRRNQRIIHAADHMVIPAAPPPWETLLVDHVKLSGAPRRFGDHVSAWIYTDHPSADPTIAVLVGPRASLDRWGRQVR